jgi:Aspartyl protease/PDZ domain
MRRWRLKARLRALCGSALRSKAFHLTQATAAAFLLTTTQAQTTQPAALGKLAFEWIDNRIFVQVMLNGEGPFHMILDTGADLSISPEVAKKLQLQLASAGETGGVGEKTVPLQSTHIRELSFGPVHLTNLESNVIPTADSTYVFGNIPVDGFLGLEVFQRYVVRHDYETRELTFYDPKTYAYNGPGESVPFERDGNIPVIEAAFDGIAGKFGVDTGARSALILYGPFVASNKIDEKYHATFQGVSGWGIGGPVRSYMVRSRSLKIGKYELHDLIARLSLNKSGATATSSKAGLIGPDVLKQFTFICDYARGRLIFEKNANFGTRDHYDRSGMWISQKGDAFEVFDVISGGPADHSGLKVGDVILSVNGRRTSELELTDVRDQWKKSDSGTTITLQVQNAAGEKREVTVVLRDLV